MGRSERAKSVVKKQCECVCHREQEKHCEVCESGLVWLSDDWVTFFKTAIDKGIHRIEGMQIIEDKTNEG